MDNLIKNMILMPFNLLYKVSPELDLKILFRLKQGYGLNLKNPRTFNEKIQWIKLNDHNLLMPGCCDKYTVREYVEKQGCGRILNRLLWEGFDPEEIPFDELPEKFVIKVTHGSAFNIICTDKGKLNRKQAVCKCKKWLKSKFLPCYGEWFYGKVKPRVIVEEYIENEDGEQLRDYKVYCLNGKPKVIGVFSDRFINTKSDFFTVDWNRLPGVHTGCKNSDYEIKRPECLSELLDAAEKLSEPFLLARIDFYIVGKRLIFGEITFTDGAGFDKYSSYEFDLGLGGVLKLSSEKTGNRG